MPRPTFPRDFSCAAQQWLPNTASSIGRWASSAFRGRAAIVLLGVVLICGAAAAREFEISIRDRRIEGSASTLRVKRGATVVLRFRTDEAVSLHVRGSDLRANPSAATLDSIRFEAKVAGRFPFTAHEFGAVADPKARPKRHRKVTLLYFEVLPE